ncbi:MAG: glycosyltransferase [Pseudoxanthomonas suwonensis]|nr:MAG: glycosyltransferase [Pseudoxanthomonas suwonensis]
MILSFSVLDGDPRVLKQIAMFRDEYEIVSVGYGPRPQGVAEHIEVPRSIDPLRPSFRHLMLLLALRRYHRAYFGSRRVRFVQESVRPGSMDVILANDVIAVPLALSLAPGCGVHADLHEYASRQREEERWWRTLVGPFQAWMVRNYVARASSVTTVSPGLAAEYSREFDVPAEVVPNAAPYHETEAPTSVGSPIRLVHMGGSVRGRALREMIEAVIITSEREPGRFTLDLYLKGGEKAYEDQLKEMVASDRAAAVNWRDPVRVDRIVQTLAAYDVGLIVYPPTNFNIVHALPNKLYDYIQARLGVVVGPGADMKDLVESAGCGLAVTGTRPEQIAEALLATTNEQILGWKLASHQHADRLSAERSSLPWSAAIRTLIESGRSVSR